MKNQRSLLAALAGVALVAAAATNHTTVAAANSAHRAGTTPAEIDPVVANGLQRFPALLGQAEAGTEATGEPIMVGFVTMDTGNFVYKMYADSADNAVRFINSVGGIGGRPIELVHCGTDSSPESTQTCATRLVNEEGIVAVGLGVDFNAATTLTALEAEGGSAFGGVALFDPERSAPNANYYYSNWGFQLAAADFAAEVLNAETAAILSSDSATGVFLAENRAGAPLERVGLTADIYTAATTAGNFDALATNALGHDVVVANGGGLMCSGIPISLTNIGFTGPIIHPDGCNDEATLAASNGMYFAQELYNPLSDTSGLPDYAAAELELYVTESESGAPDLALGGHEQIAFAEIINFAETLAASGATEFDMASVTELLSTATGANFNSDEYDCGTTYIDDYPALCSLVGRVYQWDGESMILQTGDMELPSAEAIG